MLFDVMLLLYLVYLSDNCRSVFSAIYTMLLLFNLSGYFSILVVIMLFVLCS